MRKQNIKPDKQSSEMNHERKGRIRITFANFGILGWSITIPVLIALSIGIWCDRHFKDQIPWAIVLVFAGFVLGFFYAIFWIRENDTGTLDKKPE